MVDALLPKVLLRAVALLPIVMLRAVALLPIALRVAVALLPIALLIAVALLSIVLLRAEDLLPIALLIAMAIVLHLHGDLSPRHNWPLGRRQRGNHGCDEARQDCRGEVTTRGRRHQAEPRFILIIVVQS